MKINACPVCKGQLIVKEYCCIGCNMQLRGNFERSWLEGLSGEQLDFVRMFVLVQGNIKEMERILNVSYPTVKNRLADIIRSLKGDDSGVNDFSDIMNDLEEGFISVEDALGMIEARRMK